MLQSKIQFSTFSTDLLDLYVNWNRSSNEPMMTFRYANSSFSKLFITTEVKVTSHSGLKYRLFWEHVIDVTYKHCLT